ncbi:alpha-2-macroglobulin family protein [Pontibaca salina]|uniref:Alpha-2-macroglobulin family protein n=1 Tax=Pontibaca salina TaxID=2795731 RepID=A0A934HRZ1_9RHOB|nr:alpha-2-macroglobulin family protein [Pontibaca salina]MBI6630677.1 alpha-2-macroglobulin family protein [Pontibaca salina]
MRRFTLAVGIWIFAVLAASGAWTQNAVPDFRYLVARDTDFHGTDLDALFDTDLESCTRACSANDRCEAFTYNTRSNACFPKTELRRYTAFSGAISASKRAHDPGLIARAETRRSDLDFLDEQDIARARDQARDLGFRHPALGGDLAAVLNARRSEEAVGALPAALNWAGISVSLSDRADLWTDYARLLLAVAADTTQKRQYHARAIAAAINGYLRADAAAEQTDALAYLATALEETGRGRDMIGALRLSYDLQPRAETEMALADAIGKYGFRVTGSSVESDAAAPRICAQFSETLAAGVDYETFVRLPNSTLAVQAEDSQLCIDGVEHGERYRLTLRTGLPAASGETLAKDVELAQYVRDRRPEVRFPGRAYMLPKAADAALPVETVNVDRLDLRLRRVSDRNLLRTMQERLFARPLSHWQEDEFTTDITEEVWTGTAEVANDLNRDMTARLPMGEAIAAQPAGIYALSAQIPGADPYDDPGATQWFVLSDLGISTMAGTDGLHVTLRSLADAKPVKGVAVSLISRANAVLAQAVSDADGRVAFDFGLMRGTGGAAPALVLAERGETDMAFLSLTDPAFDLSDRGVEGRAPAGPVDVFLTTDRGAYRAGETIHVTTLARDAAAQAVDGLPLTAILSRPDGVEYRRLVSRDGQAGGHVFAVPLGVSVPRGTWRLDIKTDPDAPALASQTVLVEDFLPERIDFDLALPDAPLRFGQTPGLEIDARYLFGAPGADLSVEGQVTLRAADAVASWPGYRFGRHDARGWATNAQFGGMHTDAQGQAVVRLDLPTPDAPNQPLEARVTVRLADGSARPVEREITAPVRPAASVIAIKPLFDDVVDEGGEAAFQVIGLSPDLTATPMQLRWTLNRIETRYQWYELYGNWNWEPTTRRERIATGTVEPGEQPATITQPVQWGEYELVLERADGDYAAASVKFDAGWYAPADAATTPDRLEVSLDKPSYRVGDTARLRIDARMGGVATIAVLSNHVIARQTVAIAEGDIEIPLEVTEDWGTGAYVTATLIRPMDVAAGQNPSRALGLAHARVEPEGKLLNIAIEAPEIARPRQSQRIGVSVKGAQEGEEVWLTLAAVDLGILNLTGFAPPDPEGYFFGQHRLGVELRDVYGRLIDGMKGALGMVRSGGDANAMKRMQSPPPTQKLVAQFSGPVRVDAQGRAEVDVDLPDFNGTVRLMAVAWSPRAVGQASRDMIVRDPVVVNVTLPNFLAPGDHSRIRLDVTHADGLTGEMTLALEPRGDGLSLGKAPSTFDLAQGGKASFSVPVSAEAIGDPGFDVVLTTPDGQMLRQSLTLPVRANDPVVAQTRRFTLDAGETFLLSDDVFAGLRPGTAQAMFSAGPLAKFDVPHLLTLLDSYPYGCTEQVASQAMPLLYLSSVAQEIGLGSAAAMDERIDDSISRVLTRQAPNGAFGLWQAGSGDFWLDAYIGDFLSRARAKGHDVPDRAFAMAMDNLRNRVNYAPDFDNGGEDIAYALLVLAREGAAAMGDLRYYADVKRDAFATPLAAAQLGAALAAYGDQTRADAMFARAGRMLRDGADEAPAYRADYGTHLRDTAGVMALAIEVGSDAVDIDALGTRIAQSDRHRSTQEAAWTLLAARALADAPEQSALRINGAAVNGPFVRRFAGDIPAQGAEITADRATELTLTTLGVPETAPEAGGTGYAIERRFLSMAGTPLDTDRLAVGTRFVTVLTITPFEDIGARLIVDDPLPAGIEIDNPNLLRAGDVGALDWLDLSEADHAEFRSDRFIAALDLPDDATVTLAYIARATSPGEFHHPAASVEAMYRPRYRAHTDSGRLAVTE